MIALDKSPSGESDSNNVKPHNGDQSRWIDLSDKNKMFIAHNSTSTNVLIECSPTWIYSYLHLEAVLAFS